MKRERARIGGPTPRQAIAICCLAAVIGCRAPAAVPVCGALHWDGTSCVEPFPPGTEIPRDFAFAPTLDGAVFRDARRAPRLYAVIVTEIDQLQALLVTLPFASLDRPMVVRRLAEDNVEIEKASEVPEAARDHAGKEAIRFYSVLIAEYSGDPSATFPSSPPRPYHALDEVTYYRALEYERAGDDDSALHAYSEIIVKSPTSAYVPKAYLALGERRFEAMRNDKDASRCAGTSDRAWASKWDRTWATYRENVLATPAAENPVYGYAWYKLGYVYANVRQRFLARYAFQQAVDFAARFPETPGAKVLGEDAQARINLLSR